MTREPLGECDNCGADLYPNEPHDCPVTGSTVTAEPMENTGREGNREMDKHFSTDEAMIRDFYRNVTGYGELSGAAMDSMLKDAALVAGIRGYYDGQVTLAELGWA